MIDPKIKFEIQDVIAKLEDLRATLRKEQEESEKEHAEWKDDPQDEDEPDVIDNDEDADRLDRAINFLEKAVGELDD